MSASTRRVTIAVAAFCLGFGAVQLYRWQIWMFGTDTGTFAQIVPDAFGGFRDGPEQGTHFRFHWAPLLAVLYPLVALSHSALSIQFAQIVLIGTPRFRSTRSRAPTSVPMRPSASGLLALIYPPLMAVAFGEFHEIAFYPAIALGVFWAADRDAGARLRCSPCFVAHPRRRCSTSS